MGLDAARSDGGMDVASGEKEADCEMGSGRALCPETVPPENAGGEEVKALYSQIEMLEKRCMTLQRKLNARPITSTDITLNPLQLSVAGKPEVPPPSGRIAFLQYT